MLYQTTEHAAQEAGKLPMVDVDRQRVPGTSDMAILLPHSGLQRAQIEAGSFERSAQVHVALVHHVDNRRDQLGVRA
jgi:hypothetical protein